MKRRSFLKYIGMGTMSLFIPAEFIPKEAPFETIEPYLGNYEPLSLGGGRQALTMEHLTKITNDYFKRNGYTLRGYDTENVKHFWDLA